MEAYIDEFRMLDAMHDLSYSSALDGEGLYHLVLAATGDEAKASRAMADRTLARMRAGIGS